MKELKPCPFCGGEVSADIVVTNDEAIDFIVGCDTCYARINNWCRNAVDFETAIKIMDDLTDKWNRRTE